MTSRHLCKAVGVVVLAASSCAFAQYGGGGGMGGTTSGGTYSPTGKSYGNGAAIGGAVGGAAGVGALLLYMHHRHNAVVGCVAPDGKTINAGKHTYQLTGSPVTAGEKVSVVGKKSKGPSGMDELDVRAVKKDMGQCQQSASAGSGGQ